ncbi:hypothetical protein QBC46DRAFT_451909 [Diplogelasinospora grovesii]|uniref:Uncharacterized protein n=1 Tax=Diplogelasinospora grovesii TaxID=303347 RepID=A0AAN6N2A2_9PEZI|nr:hypothetical protein QBC46DRAFT_451909 [Diplogelasinospora grovesii]
MGLGDDFKKVENAVDGQDSANQTANDSTGKDAKWDTVADSAVDGFASKEGMPAAADPEINNVVNDEINKF